MVREGEERVRGAVKGAAKWRSIGEYIVEDDGTKSLERCKKNEKKIQGLLDKGEVSLSQRGAYRKEGEA